MEAWTHRNDKCRHVTLMSMSVAFYVTMCAAMAHAAYPVAVENVFTPLRPGAVKPKGWMLDRAKTAVAGMSGHLDKYDVEFARAWSRNFKPSISNLTWEKGAWSYEGGGYWFDGLVRLAAQLEDPALEKKARSFFQPTLEDVKPSSLCLLSWAERSDPTVMEAVLRPGNDFALSKCGLMGRALVAMWEAFGDPRVPQVLAHAFDDVRIIRGTSGALHLPVAAFDAWRITGDEKTRTALDEYYADTSKITSPAIALSLPPSPEKFNMTVKVIRGEDWRIQHGVLNNESLLAWLRGWQWTGREEWRDAVFAWMDWFRDNATQPHGVIVSDESFGYPGAERGTETCTVAASIWLNLQLLAATGDGRWADAAERALFNAAPACVSRDYCRHVYFQAPNRTTPLRPEYKRCETPITPYRYERKHFPLCCTADLTRIIPMGIQYKWLVDADGLVAALYGPDETRTEIAGVAVTVSTYTDYPFSEDISIRVMPERESTWTMKLRIPAWCDTPSIRINGRMMKDIAMHSGFASIKRLWRKGDGIDLNFPMNPKLTTLIDRNVENAPTLGFVSLGPLLMVAPLAEFDDNNPVWRQKYDWRLDPKTALATTRITRDRVKPDFNWPIDAPLKLEIQTSRGSLNLVPYGCAKFRIAVFPL